MNLIDILREGNAEMNNFSKRKIISQSKISKKIAEMNEQLQGFWANDN